MSPLRRAFALLAAGALWGCTAPPSETLLWTSPEAASGRASKPGWRFEREAVVAAHPLAAQAGAQVLAKGGNAVDAAVATQLVLAVVEPQSSGLGGGGFLVLWDGHTVRSFDGRETAPAAASENLFLTADGEPYARERATASGLGVGVPGLLRLLDAVHRQYGRLAWSDVVEPGALTAEHGFNVSPRLHHLLQIDPHLRQDAAASAFYLRPDGSPWPVGHRLRNPALAALLHRVAREGVEAFYQGVNAEDLVRRVQTQALPGRLTTRDLAAYSVKEREPLCGQWLRWRYCGMGPPAAGTVMVGQLLALADSVDLASAEGLVRYVQAASLASADRDLHLADPDFVPAPAGDWRALLAPDYLAQRTKLLGRATVGVAGGQPQGWISPWAPQDDAREGGTTHLSVVDAHGMAVSLTSSVESAFGSRILVDGGTQRPGGYFLNNQLTDFAFRPRSRTGRPVANRVEPGKRPRSSMAPMVIFEGNELRMVVGSPGGLGIPHFTAKVLLRHLGAQEPLQAAVDAPNVVPLGGRVALERGGFNTSLKDALRASGYRSLETETPSGVHALSRTGGLWQAAADPRREGTAAGR